MGPLLTTTEAQNGGKYDFIIEPDHNKSIPVDQVCARTLLRALSPGCPPIASPTISNCVCFYLLACCASQFYLRLIANCGCFQGFWDDLMASSRAWGLKTYEQDWLHNEFTGLDAVRHPELKVRTPAHTKHPGW